MKKLVFTIQMIVLMASLPVYLLVELNHETGNVTVSTPAPVFSTMKERKATEQVSASEEKGLSLFVPAIFVTD